MVPVPANEFGTDSVMAKGDGLGVTTQIYDIDVFPGVTSSIASAGFVPTGSFVDYASFTGFAEDGRPQEK